MRRAFKKAEPQLHTSQISKKALNERGFIKALIMAAVSGDVLTVIYSAKMSSGLNQSITGPRKPRV
jgi:uncharacterized protein YihD (DUF1040 family)